MDGWIKLHRKITEWEWYRDSETMRIFLHLLLQASHAPARYHGINIERGQVVTWRSKLARELDITEQEVRTGLLKLKLTGEITLYSTNKYSVITIIKYNDYQHYEPDELKLEFNSPAKAPAEPEKSTSKSTDKSTNKSTSETTSETTSYNPTATSTSAETQPANQPANQPAEQPAEQPANTPANAEKSTSKLTTIQEEKNVLIQEERKLVAQNEILPKTQKTNDIEKRQKVFYDEIEAFSGKYPPSMLRAFYNYWSEPNRSKTKQRFELQTTWDLSRRLDNWARRDNIIPQNTKSNEKDIRGATSNATGSGAFGRL